jgi:hypothetical protein
MLTELEISSRRNLLMRLSRSLALLSFALIVFCSAAFADSTFDFSTDGHINATSFMFSGTGGASITLYGYSKNGSVTSTFPTDLWYKHDGAGETGIGLKDDPAGEHEIAGTNFVEFTDAGITSIKLGSVQSGESYALYGSNTLGVRGTHLIASGNSNDATISGLVALDSGYTYLSLGIGTVVDPGDGNILLASATYAPSVPEPGTPEMLLTLAIVGLLAFGGRKLVKLSI